MGADAQSRAQGGGNRHPGGSRASASAPAPASLPVQEPSPAIPRRPATQYDAANRFRIRQVAMGERETHIKMVRQPGRKLSRRNHFTSNTSRPRAPSCRKTPVNSFPAMNSNSRHYLRPPLPGVTPATTVEELIQKIFKAAPGLVIGEARTALAACGFSLRTCRPWPSRTSRRSISHRLLNDFNQVELDQFFESGSMPDDLRVYLQKLKKRSHREIHPA